MPIYTHLLLWLQTKLFLHDVRNVIGPFISLGLDVEVVQGEWCPHVDILLLGWFHVEHCPRSQWLCGCPEGC
jgi:hypothetical protein